MGKAGLACKCLAIGLCCLIIEAQTAQSSSSINERSMQGTDGPQKQTLRVEGTHNMPPPIKHRAENSREEVQRMYLLRDLAEQAEYMASPEWQGTHKLKLARAKQRKVDSGILIPAGGEKLLAMTFAMIKVLRSSLQCKLPIEVVYSNEQEMSAQWRRKLEMSFPDVHCVGAVGFKDPRGEVPVLAPPGEGLEAILAAGDMQKIFALCCVTSFNEVLLIEADSLPLRNPEDLFETQQFKEHGSLFWPGHWSAAQGDRPGWLQPDAYTLFDLRPPWQAHPEAFATAETGQLIINRSKHADVLQWLWFLTTHHDVMFKLYTGDTESFRLAFHLAGKGADYAHAAHRPSAALSAQAAAWGASKEIEEQPARYLFAGVMHYDPHGRPAFLHRMGKAKSGESGAMYRHVDYCTAPLSPTTALGYTDHAGDYFEGHQIDTGYFKECPSRKDWDLTDLDMCKRHQSASAGMRNAGFPIPALPIQASAKAADAIALNEQWLGQSYAC